MTKTELIEAIVIALETALLIITTIFASKNKGKNGDMSKT